MLNEKVPSVKFQTRVRDESILTIRMVRVHLRTL